MHLSFNNNQLKVNLDSYFARYTIRWSLSLPVSPSVMLPSPCLKTGSWDYRILGILYESESLLELLICTWRVPWRRHLLEVPVQRPLMGLQSEQSSAKAPRSGSRKRASDWGIMNGLGTLNPVCHRSATITTVRLSIITALPIDTSLRSFRATTCSWPMFSSVLGLLKMVGLFSARRW